jgi:hypothetical protein
MGRGDICDGRGIVSERRCHAAREVSRGPPPISRFFAAGRSNRGRTNRDQRWLLACLGWGRLGVGGPAASPGPSVASRAVLALSGAPHADAGGCCCCRGLAQWVSSFGVGGRAQCVHRALSSSFGASRVDGGCSLRFGPQALVVAQAPPVASFGAIRVDAVGCCSLRGLRRSLGARISAPPPSWPPTAPT